MQRKKSPLHQRPLVPSGEKIMHDLAEAHTDDVIFKIKDLHAVDETNCKNISLEESEILPDTAYIKVDTFLREKNKLTSYFITLSEQKANLGQWKANLLEKMNRMKKEMSKPSFL